jgi:drug/metabolite transporter (DMT)-like permease
MNRYVASLLGASLLWGCAWIPLKALGDAGLDGLTLTLGAFAPLALITTLYSLRMQTFPRGRGGALILIALLGGGANLAFTVAMLYGEVVRVMVLFYLLPLWGVLGGRFILGERIDGLRWLGVVFALVGAWLVLGGVNVLESMPSWYEWLGLLAGFLYAMNNLVFRAVQELPLSSKLSAMFFGCASLALLAMLVTGINLPQGLPTIAWGGLLLYSVAWLLLANLGAQWGVVHLEAGRASVILIVELVAAVISATLIGKEQMAPLEWGGAVLILTATLIEALRGESSSIQKSVVLVERQVE